MPRNQSPKSPRSIAKLAILIAAFTLLSAQDSCDPVEVVQFRIVNLREDGVAVNACVIEAGGVSRGPLLTELLPAGEVQSHFFRSLRPGEQLRWITGTDCTVPAPGTTDVELAVVPERQTVVLYGNTTLETEIFGSDVVPALDPGRFYVRFFHGATGLGVVETTQVQCGFLFPAFTDTDLGELGFSPNNQDTFFSASVTIGQDSFSTTILVCDDTFSVVYSTPYEFFGGTQVTFFLRGDSPPYQVTACDDADPVGTRCAPIP
ncbi:MAG: hypothetical protein AAF500_14120 [Myxococcota bacterium]